MISEMVSPPKVPVFVPSILLVDDEPDFRILAKTLLGLHGRFEFFEASSAFEANAMLRNTKFDLVVCDLFMQTDTGLDVFSFLEKSENDTAFVLLTASVDALKPEFHDRICVLDKADMSKFIKELTRKGFL